MREVTLRMSEVEYRNLKRIIQQQKEFAQKGFDHAPDTAQGYGLQQAAQQAMDMADGLLAQMTLQEIAAEDSGPTAKEIAERDPYLYGVDGSELNRNRSED